MLYSAGQAAKVAGVSKTTISNKLKNGDLSYVSKSNSGYEIDPAELARVFPDLNPDAVTNGKDLQSVTPKIVNKEESLPPVNRALEVEVKMLREQIERMDTERERERVQNGEQRTQLLEQIETLKEQAERQSADHRQALAVLTDQRSREEIAKKGFWARMFG